MSRTVRREVVWRGMLVVGLWLAAPRWALAQTGVLAQGGGRSVWMDAAIFAAFAGAAVFAVCRSSKRV